jgi:hypothetical protein
MDLNECVKLILGSAAVVALWLRFEHRLTRVEDKVQERYRDKKQTESRFSTIEKWLPQKPNEPL